MRGERKVEDVHGATKSDADAHAEVDQGNEIIGNVHDGFLSSGEIGARFAQMSRERLDDARERLSSRAPKDQ